MHESDSLLQLIDVRQRLVAIEQRLSQERSDSARLRRELALRNAALDVGTSHFMIVDARTPDRQIVYVNRPLARAHGYEPQELMGRPVAMLMLAGEMSQAATLEMDAQLAADKPYRVEIQALRRDGSPFWVGFTAVGLRDEHGRITHIVTVGADITARLESERQSKVLQEQLISEMRERERMAIELRLAQKLESVGRLAAGLAHEINTPIQYVCDSVHFLRSSFEDLVRLADECRSVIQQHVRIADPAAYEAVAAVEQQIDYEFLRAEVPRAFERTGEGTDRVARLVRAMKEFAHPDTIEHVSADLNRAIETTLMVCRSEYKYVAQVAMDLQELPAVVCNIGELNQVFLNLVVNAAHAIQDAGRSASDGCIRIATRVVGSTVEVDVQDNGCGIAPENLDKIFDPFFTTKEIGRGTGQGLSMARSIVIDKHHGDLRVGSKQNVGTTFTIVLPIGASLEEAA